ncbi:MAG: signal peptidase I [Myxococcaceae bacterium]|nr:signal peptidase I [Myxococcaceae bacterium]
MARKLEEERQVEGVLVQGGPRRWGRKAWGRLIAGAALLVLVLLLRGFVVQPRVIVTDSMAPTLVFGDRLVMDKLSYRFHPPRPGDIVVFDLPPQTRRPGALEGPAAVKRVIALGGQSVEVRGGQVFVDGQALHEPYVAEAPRYTAGPLRVPEGMLYVLGDNRNVSSDSHHWGFLPQQRVIGRAWLRFWPPGRAGNL